jgi:hypothetical protein
MMKLTNIALWTVRVTGPVQVVLGLLFWSGHALTLVSMHMLIGIVFVLGVLVLAGTAAWARLGLVPVVLSIALGLVIPVFGITQTRLLPGPAHWMVQLTHLLIAMAAMGVAARLARFTLSHPRRGQALARESSGRAPAA